jgi:hypothetical protein
MRKICLLILLFVAVGFCGNANEVALVTELSGKVTADLRGDVWTLELAEMIPAESIVKTGSESHLIIAHFPLNVELKVGENSQIKIGEKSFESEQAVETTLMKMVAANISLANDMNQQTGAVDSDKVLTQKFSKRSRSSSTIPQKAKTLKEEKKSDLVAPGLEDSFNEEEVVNAQPETSIVEISGRISGEEAKPSIDMTESSFSSNLVSNSSNQELALIKIGLALPAKVYEGLLLEETLPVLISEFATAEITGVENKDNWYLLSLSLPTLLVKNNKRVALKTKDGVLEIAVNSFNEKTPAVKDLWMLEQNGFYSQAAMGWVRLHSLDLVKDRNFISHMKRLESKM